MMKTPQTKKTFQEVMNEYKALGEMMRTIIRNIAVKSLKQWGVEEIGSSDVNCQIVQDYHSCNQSWDEVVRYGLDLIRSQRA
jgi:hypothetical protein